MNGELLKLTERRRHSDLILFERTNRPPKSGLTRYAVGRSQEVLLEDFGRYCRAVRWMKANATKLMTKAEPEQTQ